MKNILVIVLASAAFMIMVPRPSGAATLPAVFLGTTSYRMKSDAIDYSLARSTVWTTSSLKYDLDTTVAYSPKSHLRLFVGLKAQQFINRRNDRKYSYSVAPNSYGRGTTNLSFQSYGLGLGVAATAPLWRNAS